jgi:hypothetical protein
VDRTGECADGDEMVGTWETRGRQVGSVVCVDNPKDGTAYFKIVFTSDTGTAAVVVQDDSAAEAYTWWLEHAAGQFYGIGPS